MLLSKKNDEKEVTIAVKILKKHTAVVADGVIAEKLKYGLLLKCLCNMLNECEDTYKWKNSITFPLHKAKSNKINAKTIRKLLCLMFLRVSGKFINEKVQFGKWGLILYIMTTNWTVWLFTSH